MKSVHLTIPGEPMGKQRPRFNSRSNTVYTPEETLDYEDYIKAAYRRYYGSAIAFKDELVCVSIKAYMSIPNFDDRCMAIYKAKKSVRDKIIETIENMSKGTRNDG